MEKLLSRVTQSLAGARTLEDLARPLLDVLETVSGLESTYLTRVDEAMGVQHVQFARNTRHLNIPEGLSVPWDDTLCKRALDEARPYTNDVANCWGDSQAAGALGIKTYASAPVRTSDGLLYGTLCGASAESQPCSEAAVHLLGLFSVLIAQFVERDRLLEELRLANTTLTGLALTDGLTGLANRRALDLELDRILARAQRSGTSVLVGFVDLDDFKEINDKHGHEIGDQFLCAIAARLGACVRAGDVLARLGGDEFVLAGEGPAVCEANSLAPELLRHRLSQCLEGRFELHGSILNYGGASVGVAWIDPSKVTASSALRNADEAMYREKVRRRAERS